MCGLKQRDFFPQAFAMMRDFLLHVDDCDFKEGDEGGSHRSAKNSDSDVDLTSTSAVKKKRENVLALASSIQARQD